MKYLRADMEQRESCAVSGGQGADAGAGWRDAACCSFCAGLWTTWRRQASQQLHAVQIWNSVKSARPAEGSGLTREQFGLALRLVAFAQSEPHPTPEAMAAAASSAAWRAAKGRPLPAPKLLPDDRCAARPR